MAPFQSPASVLVPKSLQAFASTSAFKRHTPHQLRTSIASTYMSSMHQRVFAATIKSLQASGGLPATQLLTRRAESDKCCNSVQKHLLSTAWLRICSQSGFKLNSSRQLWAQRLKTSECREFSTCMAPRRSEGKGSRTCHGSGFGSVGRNICEPLGSVEVCCILRTEGSSEVLANFCARARLRSGLTPLKVFRPSAASSGKHFTRNSSPFCRSHPWHLSMACHPRPRPRSIPSPP